MKYLTILLMLISCHTYGQKPKLRIDTATGITGWIADEKMYSATFTDEVWIFKSKYDSAIRVIDSLYRQIKNMGENFQIVLDNWMACVDRGKGIEKAPVKDLVDIECAYKVIDYMMEHQSHSGRIFQAVNSFILANLRGATLRKYKQILNETK